MKLKSSKTLIQRILSSKKMFKAGDKVYYRNSDGIQTGIIVKESDVKTIYEVRIGNGLITFFKQKDLKPSNISNADRIRNMTDKELKEFLSSKFKCWNQFHCMGCEFYKKGSFGNEYYCDYSEEGLEEWLLRDADTEGGDLKCS